LLPTFADTFGFSAIEAMAQGTPVIGTRICALPEFIRDGNNGILLDLETTAIGEWKNPGSKCRGTEVYARYFREQVEKLSDELVLRLEEVLGSHDRLQGMRLSAYKTAKEMFDAENAAALWDDLYTKVIEE
jgi:glycosyltransferase involved in cell wall biosynthesis